MGAGSTQMRAAGRWLALAVLALVMTPAVLLPIIGTGIEADQGAGGPAHPDRHP